MRGRAAADFIGVGERGNPVCARQPGAGECRQSAPSRARNVRVACGGVARSHAGAHALTFGITLAASRDLHAFGQARIAHAGARPVIYLEPGHAIGMHGAYA